MLTRHTQISILKTRYALGQSWFVGNTPHFDAWKADTHISDNGSLLWQKVLVSRSLFTSRNLNAVLLSHSRIWIVSVCMELSGWQCWTIPLLYLWKRLLTYRRVYRTDWILSLHSFRPVPWTSTTVPVILDYLLEIEVVWLLTYFS